MMILNLLVFGSLLAAGAALTCYKCQSVRAVANSGLTKSFLDSVLKSNTVSDNPACFDASLDNIVNLDQQECPYDGSNYMCADARAKVIVAGVEYETVIRDCSRVDNYSPGSGCNSDVTQLRNVFNIFSAFTNGAQFDGEICYCGTDYCTAGRCEDGSVKITNYCVKNWILGVVIGGAVLVILLITACCCCCCCGCCACCKRSQPGVVLAAPMVTVPYGRLHDNQNSIA